MVTLFAHLSRDPVPSNLMKTRAPQVFRYIERMNTAGIVDGEFPDMAPEYFPDDELPSTLEPVLRYLFADCAPEILGMVDTFNQWCDAHPGLPAGTPIQSDPDVFAFVYARV
jgi:hypothetical protein